MQNTKQKIAWLWQNAEKILIVVFFLTFSLNISKVFLTPFSFPNGGFNEYTTMSFSWADLLMIEIIIIYNIKLLVSQFRQGKTTDILLENVIRNESSVIRNYYSKNVSRETLYLLIFLGWVSLSIFWSQYRPIAIFRFLILTEIVLFAFVVIKQLKNSRWLNIAVFALVLNGIFQSILGITQFIHNGSLGLYFLGESIIGPNVDGVAKILINSEKHIRAYGTFPHPNILAGFLTIPLLLIFAEFVQRKLLLTSSQLSPYQEEGGDNSPFLYKERVSVRCNNVSHETILVFIPTNFLWFLFSITGFGFLLTFSRSAFLGLFLGLMSYVLLITWNRNLVQEFKSSIKIPAFFFIILILIIIILLNTTSFFSNQSLQERKLYQYVSYETISRHPIQGVGAGQFVIHEYYAHPNFESWQYQPVHSVYLLAFSELGIVGLIFLLLWIFSILEWGDDKNRNTGLLLTRLSICCIIFSFLTISLFDHYPWDIKLGMIIFTLPLIILFAELEKEEN